MFQDVLKVFRGVLKGLLFFGLGLTATTYMGFVLFRLWDWFVAPAFHLPRISA
jgi:hypothetical protein